MTLAEVIALHGQEPDGHLSSAELGWFELHRYQQGQDGGALLHEDAAGLIVGLHYGTVQAFSDAWQTVEWAVANYPGVVPSDEQDEEASDPRQPFAQKFEQIMLLLDSTRAPGSIGVRTPDTAEPGTAAEEGERKRLPPPRIWAGSLADYNNGRLFGEWVDAAQDADELREEITALMARSPTPGAEEWAIFDFDGFGAVTDQLDEYESLERISLIAQGISRHGEAFAAYVAYLGAMSIDEQTEQRFQEAYCGEWESTSAYAEHLLQESGAYELLESWAAENAPEQIRPYVTLDLARYTADLEADLYISGKDGGIWVFDTSC